MWLCFYGLSPSSSLIHTVIKKALYCVFILWIVCVHHLCFYVVFFYIFWIGLTELIRKTCRWRVLCLLTLLCESISRKKSMSIVLVSSDAVYRTLLVDWMCVFIWWSSKHFVRFRKTVITERTWDISCWMPLVCPVWNGHAPRKHTTNPEQNSSLH